MIEEEEKFRSWTDFGITKLIDLSEETDVAHVEAEERYEAPMEQDALSICGEGPAEDKVEMTIAGPERDRWFRAHLPETLDIGEAYLGGAYAIKGKTATDSGIEESYGQIGSQT